MTASHRDRRSGQPVFRFAPSPTGTLHIGHAYSALLNERLARETGGRLLLRIEDTDTTRCRPQFEASIIADLDWLGIAFDEPPRRQSDHFPLYDKAARTLRQKRLLYPCFASRSEIAEAVAHIEATGEAWPRDPDGSPHYPGIWRDAPDGEVAGRIAAGEPHAWRIDMARALDGVSVDDLAYEEFPDETATRTTRVSRDPSVWGDFVIVRKDAPASFHLAGVVDEDVQGVTDVVRGQDLAQATGLHRLLQHHLGLVPPRYRHHRLIAGEDGEKLSKSRGSLALAALREAGESARDIRARLGFAQAG
ncbi:MAG: tRNA glutamyl-Q(34) synthetase GluQRS [Rhodobiaceae bacterium]|nr:tRNA glutamyl-Q(34) synthetase GluQRS [Rhodobiaceae bacterium]MCC0016728.1 tRNA glutamyl-Q(34) synthetase GluQRS [Rhodobiaceae bacterium]MCC0042153.1 tRNA glutamyl-Q(34) synthetase GluQRS [Rhodobiaceae bacterium]